MTTVAGVRLSEKAAAACAVTTWRDQVYLAWTGGKMSLNLASSADGREFAGKQQLAHRSYRHQMSTDSSPARNIALSPSLVGHRERLYLAWTGTDAALNVQVVDRHAYSTPITFKQRSAVSPSVTMSERGSLVLAWTGTDRHVNLLTMTENWSGVPVRLPAKSSAAPAVCSHRGSLVLAWTGTDYHLNVGRLP